MAPITAFTLILYYKHVLSLYCIHLGEGPMAIGYVTDDTLIHHSSLSLILCTIETKTSMYSINDKRQWHMTCFGAAIQDWKMIKFQVPSTRVYLYLWTWTRAPHLRADKLASQHPVQRRYILHIATLGWPVQWPSLPSPTLQSCVITLQSSPMKGYKSNQINGRIVIKERVGLDISPHPHEISKLLIPLLLVFWGIKL